jgi:hypothetical protein
MVQAGQGGVVLVLIIKYYEECEGRVELCLIIIKDFVTMLLEYHQILRENGIWKV